MKQLIACALLLSSSFFIASDKHGHLRASSNESTTSRPLIPVESTSHLSSDTSTPAGSIGTDRNQKPRRRRTSSHNNPTISRNKIDEDEEQSCEKFCAECCVMTCIVAACGLTMYINHDEQKSSPIKILPMN